MVQVSMMAVRGLVAAVERAGVERARFLSDAGVEPALLEDLHARLPLAAYRHVVRVALGSSGDPALGLHMGERSQAANFDALGHLSEHCKSLREALQLSARYTQIVTDGPQMLLQEDEATDSLKLRLTLTNSDTPEVRVTAEFAMISLLRMVRRFVGDDALPRRVCFAYPRPAHHAEYTRVFSGREHFSQKHTFMELERAWLDQTQLGGSPELRVLLQERADVLLARVELDAPAAERVKRWLCSHKLLERPNMDEVARDLGMSARSLRRRLQEEHARFDALVDEELSTRARRLIADPRSSVQDVAFAMGFASASAFSRAFKRWTGDAPRVARRSPRRLV